MATRTSHRPLSSLQSGFEAVDRIAVLSPEATDLGARATTARLACTGLLGVQRAGTGRG